MRRRRSRLAGLLAPAVAVALLALAATGSASATANSSGSDSDSKSSSAESECLASPPTKTTFRRSEEDSSVAEVVYTNCSIVKLSPTTSNGVSVLDASSLGIRVVTSFPDVDDIDLSDNKITQVAEDEDAVVSVLDLSSNGLVGLGNLTIPDGLEALILDGNYMAAIMGEDLGGSLTSLSLRNNSISSLDNFDFGSTVLSLDLSDNSMPTLSSWEMPSQLQAFTCEDCDVQVIAGLTFPATEEGQAQYFTTFDLMNSAVASWEVSNSSVDILEGLTILEATSTVSNCSDTRATLQTVRSLSLCVLSDSDYDSKYSLTSSSTSSNDTTGGAGNHNGNGSANAEAGSTKSDGSTSSWMLLAMTCLGAFLAAVLGGVGFVVYRRRQQLLDRTKQQQDEANLAFDSEASASSKATTKFVPGNTSTFTRTGRTDSAPDTMLGNSAANYLANDIRTDEEILQFRLLQKDVVRGKLLAKGGYGAVYLATFQSETVVMKQLLPDRARTKRWLMGFMDEIRICSTLDHPKIVHFIGVTWSSLLDISMVMEYMPRGDLSSMLLKQLQRETRDPLARDAYSWFHSVGEGSTMKCKSLIALDIAEALVYLHSFESPMIHRDLKPKNVLLSEQWEAKLTDFGVSRELTEDQTMTAEIGTVSWIAPEVLRGERYSEKADVYSFGVVMTELDTCRRPYSDGVPSEENCGGKNQHSNTRIAVLVSAGSLKPSVHDDCPLSVRKLAEQCLAFDPEDRPSALQIHYELRNLELGEEELAASGLRLDRTMSKSSRGVSARRA